MKLAGVVILYYPSEKTWENIRSYYDYVDHLYILDNTETISQFQTIYSNDSKIIYVHDGENKGIANRLNFACAHAKTNGYNWLLTMDQDSAFPDNMLQQYLTCISEYNDNARVAMFGINHHATVAVNHNCNITLDTELITSGSLVNLDLYSHNGFDEALFIDEVDTDFCYQAIIHGYKVILFNNIILQHELGRPEKCRSLLTLKETYRTLHSPLRCYYMLRNFLYMQQKNKGKLTTKTKARWKMLRNTLKNNFLYGKDRLKLLRYLFKAYYDFKHGKMGKFRIN